MVASLMSTTKRETTIPLNSARPSKHGDDNNLLDYKECTHQTAVARTKEPPLMIEL